MAADIVITSGLTLVECDRALHRATELELLCWDERIRENADELGFDVTPNTGEETNT